VTEVSGKLAAVFSESFVAVKSKEGNFNILIQVETMNKFAVFPIKLV